MPGRPFDLRTRHRLCARPGPQRPACPVSRRIQFSGCAARRGTRRSTCAATRWACNPRRAATLVQEELEDWQQLAVEGHWNARRPWMSYHENLGTHLASLVGARSGEVVAMNSLTVNLHLMMVSFFSPDAKRHKIVIEKPRLPVRPLRGRVAAAVSRPGSRQFAD